MALRVIGFGLGYIVSLGWGCPNNLYLSIYHFGPDLVLLSYRFTVPSLAPTCVY